MLYQAKTLAELEVFFYWELTITTKNDKIFSSDEVIVWELQPCSHKKLVIDHYIIDITLQKEKLALLTRLIKNSKQFEKDEEKQNVTLH